MKVCFIPWNFFSYLYTTISYLVKTFDDDDPSFCCMLCFHFIPSTSISYPEHGLSYQVAKFSYPKQPISYSSSHFPLFSLPDSLYVHSFTTERSSHLLGCFLWPNYVAQSSSSPTGWLWPAPTAPTCQASDALEPGSQAWSRLVVSVLQYPCCMPELPILGHTQVFACAPRRLRGDVTVWGLRITIVRARPPTASFSDCLSHQDYRPCASITSFASLRPRWIQHHVTHIRPMLSQIIY